MPDRRFRVTLDTNQLDESRIELLRSAFPERCDLSCITVSVRERGDFEIAVEVLPETAVWDESRWGQARWAGVLPEVFVIGESALGEAVLGGDEPVDVLETALGVITNGSFPRPGARGDLSVGQRHQLRDAMIFEAHVRHGQDLLVTDDIKGFVRDGRRELLEALGQTFIRTWAELAALDSSALRELVEEAALRRPY